MSILLGAYDRRTLKEKQKARAMRKIEVQKQSKRSVPKIGQTKIASSPAPTPSELKRRFPLNGEFQVDIVDIECSLS
jgi:hypothetical protein